MHCIFWSFHKILLPITKIQNFPSLSRRSDFLHKYTKQHCAPKCDQIIISTGGSWGEICFVGSLLKKVLTYEHQRGKIQQWGAQIKTCFYTKGYKSWGSSVTGKSNVFLTVNLFSKEHFSCSLNIPQLLSRRKKFVIFVKGSVSWVPADVDLQLLHFAVKTQALWAFKDTSCLFSESVFSSRKNISLSFICQVTFLCLTVCQQDQASACSVPST